MTKFRMLQPVEGVVPVCLSVRLSVCVYMYVFMFGYGMALVSRIDKIIGLFCKRAL